MGSLTVHRSPWADFVKLLLRLGLPPGLRNLCARVLGVSELAAGLQQGALSSTMNLHF